MANSATDASAVAVATDAVWQLLARLPSEGDVGYPPERTNDCMQPLWIEGEEVARRNMGSPRCDLHRWSSWLSDKPRRVFDMFIFNKEVDIMEARLSELSPFVDFFVVVEASRTHQGLPKPSKLKAYWKTRFARFAHKVIHVWVDFEFSCPIWPWVCEDYQREKLLDGFLRGGGQPDDVVIISDIDEMPRAESVHRLRSCAFERGKKPARLTLHATHFWYSAHCLRTDKKWLFGPIVTSGRSLMRWGAQQLRRPHATWGPPGKAKVDRSGTQAAWPELAAMVPEGTIRDRLKRLYDAGNLTTRALMPYVERMDSIHSSTGLNDRFAQFDLMHPADVDEQTMAAAAWHFSYFMTPEQIAIKYLEANVGKSGKDQPAAWHYKHAMRCGAPQHPKWRFRYVANLTEAEVPRFVLQNRCRMRLFFRYSRDRGAWLSNDYALSGRGRAHRHSPDSTGAAVNATGTAASTRRGGGLRRMHGAEANIAAARMGIRRSGGKDRGVV